MKPASLTVGIAGHPPVLANLRACFDPVLHCLFVADAHFGKDAVFRARGIPGPAGSTADNLMHLDILIAEFEPAMLVFLGDLLHARESHAAQTLDALHAWRVRHAGLRDCGWCWWKVITTGMRVRCRGRWVSSMCGSPGLSGRGRCVISRNGLRMRMRLRVICIRFIRSRRGPILCGCRVSGSVWSVVCCRLWEALRGERAKEEVWLGRGCFWWCRSG
jgi:hypothetical protein